MSRVAKKPIAIVKGVELAVNDGFIKVKGPKGALSIAKPENVSLSVENGEALLVPANDESIALTGTLRAIVANMVIGVSEGDTLTVIGLPGYMHYANLQPTMTFLTTPDQIRVAIHCAGRCHHHHADADRNPDFRCRQAIDR